VASPKELGISFILRAPSPPKEFHISCSFLSVASQKELRISFILRAPSPPKEFHISSSFPTVASPQELRMFSSTPTVASVL
jgi:hypothetical protein